MIREGFGLGANDEFWFGYQLSVKGPGDLPMEAGLAMSELEGRVCCGRELNK